MTNQLDASLGEVSVRVSPFPAGTMFTLYNNEHDTPVTVGGFAMVARDIDVLYRVMTSEALNTQYATPTSVEVRPLVVDRTSDIPALPANYPVYLVHPHQLATMSLGGRAAAHYTPLAECDQRIIDAVDSSGVRRIMSLDYFGVGAAGRPEASKYPIGVPFVPPSSDAPRTQLRYSAFTHPDADMYPDVAFDFADPVKGDVTVITAVYTGPRMHAPHLPFGAGGWYTAQHDVQPENVRLTVQAEVCLHNDVINRHMSYAVTEYRITSAEPIVSETRNGETVTEESAPEQRATRRLRVRRK